MRARRSCRRRAEGVSLIELLVGISVLAVLMTLGLASFGEWVRNTQVRSTAESLRAGFQMARAEAVRRNTRVRLQFTSTLDNTCQLGAAGPSWVINKGASENPASKCGQAIGDSNAPYLLQTSPAISGNPSVSIAASRPVVAFDALGRQTTTQNPTTAVQALTVDLSSTTGACVNAGGPIRCLRLVVSPAGDVRMCDLARTTSAASSALLDPMSC